MFLSQDWFTVSDREGRSKERYLFLFKARILICKVRRISDDRSVFVLKEIIRVSKAALPLLFAVPLAVSFFDTVNFCPVSFQRSSSRTSQTIKEPLNSCWTEAQGSSRSPRITTKLRTSGSKRSVCTPPTSVRRHFKTSSGKHWNAPSLHWFYQRLQGSRWLFCQMGF